MQEPGWSSLPADLLETILELLPWSSHPRFAAVCKHWRSAVSPFYPAWITPVLLNAADIGTTNLRYYSPYYHKIFEISDTLETPNAKICGAWGRQLTLCQREDYEITVVDTDLVTGVIRDLYPLERTTFEFVVYDGQRRRMYGIEAIGLIQVRRAIQSDSGRWYDVDWESSELSVNEPMMRAAPMTNAVLHGGLLYLLGVDGRLAVHDDRRHEEAPVVLDNPKGFGFGCDDCYLFESDEGELRAVLLGRRGTPMHVLRLHEKEMEWEKVESLEGRALFTGTRTTMMALHLPPLAAGTKSPRKAIEINRWNDFSKEKHQSRLAPMLIIYDELGLYISDVRDDDRFSNLQTLAEFSQKMVKTEKLDRYPMVYRLLKLVLVLPVAIATVESFAVKWMQNKIFVPRLYDWPESLHVHLVESEGELASVPTSTSKNLAQHNPMSGPSIWSCALEPQEPSEFWETIKLDYSSARMDLVPVPADCRVRSQGGASMHLVV
ncbi:hypothetical protein U9M48_014302 [Paspalum notatum var. saurae]|uniref:F-box domain-containing protein n=1 Tax=Paspalum notatum var. saurae TaxID=547442 RepID=A0AAQ3T1D8_PASNO